jgi:hypothetical protein
MASQIPAKLRDAGIAQAARRAAQLEKFKPIITYWRMWKLCSALQVKLIVE